MKKSIITICLLAIVVMAQSGGPILANGGRNLIGQNVTFGGNPYLEITTMTDTLSDPIIIEVGTSPSTSRAATFLALEYKAIAADSAASGFDMRFQSRICANPTTGTGCPTQWLDPRFRFIYNDRHFVDTVNVALVPEDTTQFSHSFLIPTGNQMRIRVSGADGDIYKKNIRIVGY